VTEKLNVVVRGPTATVAGNASVNVPSFNTVILTTRDTQLLTETINMATGVVHAGMASIGATSVNFSCTVMLIQHFTTGPIIAPLHLIRYNPIAATEE